MVLMKKKKVGIGLLVKYYLYLLVVWTVFRFGFSFDEQVEEMIVKPFLWLLPLFFVWLRDSRQVRFFEGNWLKAVMYGLLMGVFYGVAIYIAGTRRIGWLFGFSLGEVTVLSGLVFLSTSIVEELVFSGFIFGKLHQTSKRLWQSAMTTGLLFSVIHIPIGLFVYDYQLNVLLGFLGVIALVGMANAWLMGVTRNVLAPIAAHWMWSMAVLAFLA